LSGPKLRAIDAPTPSVIIDRAIVERNTRRMSERMSALSVRLRPHVKTHKCVEVAKLQVRGHFGGITVSTLVEARFFLDHGMADITYAVPLALAKIDEALDLARAAERLHLLVDHCDTVRALSEAARRRGVPARVFLKVDCGYHRAGVDPDRAESVALAQAIAEDRHLELSGILTHAGHSYQCKNAEGIRAVAREEREAVVGFARRLRAAGVGVAEVSAGSTPTMCLATNLEGVTEARPGNYVFFDAFQAAIGSATIADCALTVSTAVLGRYRSHLVIDAGALALSKDEGARHVDQDAGFGQIWSGDRVTPHPELRLSSLSQEHGIVVSRTGELSPELEVGTKLRIVPNHSCLTAALHPHYYVEEDGWIVDTWTPVRGW
jgi:D-serine deaminase-like pyridoxal phosphate-dependent protein